MPLVAGVDSSTQSTKVQLCDADTGAVLATGRATHPATTPPRSEQHPDAWWDALVEAMAAAGAALAGTGATLLDVSAIAVAGQQHGLVVLDGHGRVLRPAKLWNDTESAPHADALVDRLGARAWADAVGSVPVASFTITKLAWLAEHEPQVLAQVASLLLPHDWLTWRLTGERVTDRGDASGTGYWSPAEDAWRTDLLGLVGSGPDRGWADVLPRVLGPTEPAGVLGAEAAAALGLAPGTIVAAGTGDNMAAALGLALAPGDVAISLGTSGTVYAASTTPTADASGAVAGFADATGAFLPLVCTLNATQVTDAVARLLGVDHATFDELALAAPTGAGGLVLLPYLDGERTPNRPEATGVLAGLRTDVTRAQLARAAVEGVLCGLLDGLDALRAAGVTADGRLLLIGGGARSGAYRAVAAALSGRPVTVPAGDEHVAAGAAAQAAAIAADVAPLEVAAAWRCSTDVADELVEPGADGGARDVVRAAYARLRG